MIHRVSLIKLQLVVPLILKVFIAITLQFSLYTCIFIYIYMKDSNMFMIVLLLHAKKQQNSPVYIYMYMITVD